MTESEAIGEYVPDLKPCPFCANPVEMSAIWEIQDSWASFARIECRHCGVEMGETQSRKEYTYASGNAYDALCVRIQHALCERWNTRPTAMLTERSKTGESS